MYRLLRSVVSYDDVVNYDDVLVEVDAAGNVHDLPLQTKLTTQQKAAARWFKLAGWHNAKPLQRLPLDRKISLNDFSNYAEYVARNGQ